MAANPRLRAIPDSEASEKQLAMLEPLRSPDGDVLNIFRTMVNHPDLARRWMVFANHVLAKSTLPPRVRELLILRIGWRCGSEYEWGQHVLIGRGVGITDEEISLLMSEAIDDAWAPEERVVLQAADELHERQEIGDATWQALVSHYSVEQCMDVVFAAGQYTLVCMALKTFGVQRDDGVPGFDL